jgi:hypothetical protein
VYPRTTSSQFERLNECWAGQFKAKNYGKPRMPVYGVYFADFYMDKCGVLIGF